MYIKLFKMYIFLCWCPSVNLLTHTVLRCHGNIPAEDDEEIRSLPSPSVFQTTTWRHARALLTPKSPLQGDRDDHFHLELPVNRSIHDTCIVTLLESSMIFSHCLVASTEANMSACITWFSSKHSGKALRETNECPVISWYLGQRIASWVWSLRTYSRCLRSCWLLFTATKRICIRTISFVGKCVKERTHCELLKGCFIQKFWLFLLWKPKRDIEPNVQAALFHIMEVNGDWSC